MQSAVRSLLVLLTTLLSLITLASSAPQIAFPINAQVPPVALVSQTYVYQFSQATFSSTSGNELTYSLKSAPSWLQLDSTTRTLSGTPQTSDLGPLQIDLVADDGTGTTSLEATLVVVNSTAPEAGNVTTALVAAGSLSDTATLSLRTASTFNITFDEDIFTPLDNPYYYATSSDRSPLPSWVRFDPTALSFSGTTPDALSAPQYFGLTLYISTIKGFSEASVSFVLAVGDHQLYFSSLQADVEMSENASYLHASVKNELQLDDHEAQAQDLTAITYKGPDWIAFDNASFTLTGNIPSAVGPQNISISAQDKYGDTASTYITLFSDNTSSIFTTSDWPLINATIGSYFSYTIPKSLITPVDFSADLSLPAGDGWLSFDASNLTMHGFVPNNTTPGIIVADLIVAPNSSHQSATADIRIQLLPFNAATPAGTTSPGISPPLTSPPHSHHLSIGAAASIAVFTTLIAILLLLTLLYCVYRTMGGKSDARKRRNRSALVLSISNPIISPGQGWSKYHTNPYEFAELDMSTPEPAHSRMPTPHAAYGRMYIVNGRSGEEAGARREEDEEEDDVSEGGQALGQTSTKPPTFLARLRTHLPVLNSRDPSAPTPRLWPLPRFHRHSRHFHAPSSNPSATTFNLSNPSNPDLLQTPRLSLATPLPIHSPGSHAPSDLPTPTPAAYKPLTVAKRAPPPPPPITAAKPTPIYAQQRIRMVSHATTQRSLFATPETVRAAPAEQAQGQGRQLDPRPLAEKRASYIRGRAEARHASGALTSPQGKTGQKKKKSGLGTGVMPEPQSSAPTLMVHIPNSDLEDSRVEGDGSRDEASAGADNEVGGDAGRTDDWVTVPGSGSDTEGETSASSPRRLPPTPLPVLEGSPTRSTRELRTKSWLMTAVGRMWGEERERRRVDERVEEDVESGRGSEAGEGTRAGLTGEERHQDWDRSVDGGMERVERENAVDRRFVSTATADSGRPAFL